MRRARPNVHLRLDVHLRHLGVRLRRRPVWLASAESGKQLMLAAAIMAANLCTPPTERIRSKGNNVFIKETFPNT